MSPGAAIGDSGEEQRLIKTLPRKGFRFVGPVREAQGPAGTAVADNAVEPPKPALTLPDEPSIAVLPFTNLSSDPDQDYFADGMVDEITTALSRFKSLFVIARNSSFTYKGKVVDIKQVGRELGVRYVLEGSVRKAAGKVRIIGQLIDAATGAHLWADRFEGDLGDIFALQDRITESVVSAIASKNVSNRNRFGGASAEQPQCLRPLSSSIPAPLLMDPGRIGRGPSACLSRIGD